MTFPTANSLVSNLLLSLLLLLSLVAPSQSNNDGYSRLVDWMTQNGGRVDHRFGIVENESGIRGIHAFDHIEEGAELLFCPWELIIGSSGIDDDQMMSSNGSDGMCRVVDETARQIRLGVNSSWYPYLDHIGEQRLPADWSGDAIMELQGLLSARDVTRHLRWFDTICHGDALDLEAKKSLVAFVSRASEVGMVPIYDLLNHHNGKRNAKLFLSKEGVNLDVVGGSISTGEEIYISYGKKSLKYNSLIFSLHEYYLFLLCECANDSPFVSS